MPKRPREQDEKFNTPRDKRSRPETTQKQVIDQSMLFSRLPLTTIQRNNLLEDIYSKPVTKYRNPTTYLFCK